MKADAQGFRTQKIRDDMLSSEGRKRALILWDLCNLGTPRKDSPLDTPIWWGLLAFGRFWTVSQSKDLKAALEDFADEVLLRRDLSDLYRAHPTLSLADPGC